MSRIPVVAEINTERYDVTVTAGPNSAGQSLEVGGESVSVRFRLPMNSADIQFRVGAGQWILVDASENRWIEAPADLSKTPIAIRKAERGKGSIMAMVQVDRFVQISPTEIGSETGVQGPQGETGATGSQGIQGVQGAEGPAGPQGAVGPEGPAGPQGAQGIQGERGPAGVQGETGPAGPTGEAGAAGAPGTTGPVGPVGATGPKGDKGDTGATGSIGPQGVKGDTGNTGPTGATGTQGPAGATGPAGVNAFGSPTARTVAKATAYQATTPAKPATITINLTSDAALTLSGGNAPEADIVIGAANTVAAGTGTVIAKYKNGIAGSLVIGVNVTNTQTTPFTFTLPANWYFAVIQRVATVNVVSCFDQAVG